MAQCPYKKSRTSLTTVLEPLRTSKCVTLQVGHPPSSVLQALDKMDTGSNWTMSDMNEEDEMNFRMSRAKV
jgi:hypothetical protein